MDLLLRILGLSLPLPLLLTESALCSPPPATGFRRWPVQAVQPDCALSASRLASTDPTVPNSEFDIPDLLDCWDHRRDKKFQEKRAQRLVDLQKQIAPLKKDRLQHYAIIHRLKFEEAVSKAADMARATREKAEAELNELQSKVIPLQTEINQLTRQFWVPKDQVKANKYDLSANRYRQVEEDEGFYEEPRVTLNRLHDLEASASGIVASLLGMLD